MTSILELMQSIVAPLPSSVLKESLNHSLVASSADLTNIEHCFQLLTNQEHEVEKLRYFFHSWSMTNNSAMCISGLSNRLSKQLHDQDTIEQRLLLSQSIASLNRVTDEDLAVVGGIFHVDLFYQMATLCSGDDTWLSRRYIIPPAKEFKHWKDQNMVKSKDLMDGLLVTLANEIYTHGEVEYIYPLFRRWLMETRGWNSKQSEQALTWILVHCGHTEKAHFQRSIDAISYYCKARNVRLEEYDLSSKFDRYLHSKGRVMTALSEILQQKQMFDVLKHQIGLLPTV